MRIDKLFGWGKPTISFEFFPPKTEAGFAQLFAAINDLHSLKPSYVSVTYGAGGSTRQKTVALVERIQRELQIRSMAHLTCVGHTAEEIGGILDDLWKAGIVNVLTLRGDPPVGQSQFVATEGGFANASDLAKYARGRRDFCIGVAGYPEGHPQCLNRTRDLEMLKLKVDNGGNFVVTQLFFDNGDFYRFRDEGAGDGDFGADHRGNHADRESGSDQAVREHVRGEDSAWVADEAGNIGNRSGGGVPGGD